MLPYLGELRRQWRPLSAAFLGMSCGYSITNYITSIMAPHMIAEFGWSKAHFAAIGALGLISVLVFPFIGRLADRVGVRRTAAIGIVGLPVGYLLLGLMTSDIRLYIALYVVQGVICITTTTTVYSRAVVEHITRARGLALAIVASGPALAGAIGAPLLNNFVNSYGWRAGCVATAVFAAGTGGLALLLLPAGRDERTVAKTPRRSAREDYALILRTRSFWLLLAAMLLVNLPQVIALSQMNLVLADNGMPPAAISGMLSAFAIGVLLGRGIAGLALDRFSGPIVAASAMSLSAVGLFLIASPLDTQLVLTISLAMIGLSFGAEGDVIGFLVARSFGVAIYSSVMGLITAAIAISASLGAGLLSIMLGFTDHYNGFLMLSGVTVFLGALLLLMLPRQTALVEAA